MIDPDLYSVAQCERFSPAGAKNLCRVSNFIDLFSIKSGKKKKKADITQRAGFLISDIVHSSGGLRLVCTHGERTGFICCNLVGLQTAVLQKLLRAARRGFNRGK